MGHGEDTRLDRLVTELIRTRRRIAELQAREMRLLASGLDLALERIDAASASRVRARDLPLREIAAEFATAMRVSDRTVQARMGTAALLTTRFAATLAAWDAGRIDAGHVTAIVDAGCAIDDDAERSRYEQHVLGIAAQESPSRLRTVARAAAATTAPAAARERARRARDDRSVRVFDLDDGMARLIADGPAPLMHAIHDRLTQMGRTVLAAAAAEEPSPAMSDQAARERYGDDDRAVDDTHGVLITGPTSFESAATGDPGSNRSPFAGPSSNGTLSAGSSSDDGPARDRRTLDQVRTDILADLLLAGAPAAHGEGDALAAIAGHVQITVPALTLLGGGDDPALLAGSGPIDSDTARRLTAAAPSWTRVLTHPVTGHPVVVDRYRPSKKQRRFLATRDEHCRFPGCRMPVRRCDVDHTVDAALGGTTSTENLAHLCRRHHVLKHHSVWTVRQRPGGVLEWRSPTGRAHLDRTPASLRNGPSRVGFVPSDSVPDLELIPF